MMTKPPPTPDPDTRPWPRSYWVEEGRLLAGAQPSSIEPAKVAQKMTALLDAGIRVVVNLMEPDEVDHSGRPFTPYEEVFLGMGRARGFEVAFHRFPIPDMGVPDVGTMRKVLDTIRASIERDLPVYVHCWGGIGRTGTVVGCWLIDSGRSSPETVLGDLAELRAWDSTAYLDSPQTDEQRRFVRGWPGPAGGTSTGPAPQSREHSDHSRAVPPLSKRDRFRGALLGLAVGDALGTTVEFKKRGSFAPLATIVGGGPFGLEPGQLTDDTAMALCLAESLLACAGFDAEDQASRDVDSGAAEEGQGTGHLQLVED